MANSNRNPLNIDLNELPQNICFSKVKPNAEPLENPNSNTSFFEPHTPLEQLLSSGHDGSRIESSSRSANADPGTSTAVVVWKNRQRRSREMVRVPNISPQDWAQSRALVRHTRITYESLRIFLEHRSDTAGPLAVKHSRSDTKASELMKEQGLWLNRDKRIFGRIPGIEIGDVFFFRTELCLVGLHCQSQAGIDYGSTDQSPTHETVATSIIVSGGYDDHDFGKELIYTGQGGQDPKIHKQCGDQNLVRGNLALERSRVYEIEVRVIRRIKCDKSPNGKVYVYDGLYKVVNCWHYAGRSGFKVFKFRLLRIDGQEQMGSSLIKFADVLKANLLSMPSRGYLSLDISTGNQNLPVTLFNDKNDNHNHFLVGYQAGPMYPSMLHAKIFGDRGGGCTCNINCTSGCHCATLNGGNFAYGGNGILLKGKPVVYECGPFCRCPPSCPNRVSQKGVRNQLEVFWSAERRWGVRSLDLIRAGTFICEMSTFVLNKNGFINPRRLPRWWMEWGDISGVLPEYMPTHSPLPSQDFSVDVPMVRNASCYMSHSNNPNAFVQFVLYDHNALFPHLMIFALETIPPLRELTIDYGVE